MLLRFLVSKSPLNVLRQFKGLPEISWLPRGSQHSKVSPGSYFTLVVSRVIQVFNFKALSSVLPSPQAHTQTHSHKYSCILTHFTDS